MIVHQAGDNFHLPYGVYWTNRLNHIARINQLNTNLAPYIACVRYTRSSARSQIAKQVIAIADTRWDTDATNMGVAVGFPSDAPLPPLPLAPEATYDDRGRDLPWPHQAAWFFNLGI